MAQVRRQQRAALIARAETTNSCGAIVVPFCLLGRSDGEVRHQSQWRKLMAAAVTAANGGGMVAILLERLCGGRRLGSSEGQR